MLPLQDQKRLPGLAAVTYLLIAINVYVFYLELSAIDIEAFIAKFALIPSQFLLSNPASWPPLITSQFLHGGWFHLITNLWFLAVFGPNMERAWGSARFLIYYLSAGIAAAFLQLLFTTQADIAILGASGAIAGILGAYFVYFAHHKISTLIPLGFIPFFIGIPAGLILIYWFGLQIFGGFYASPSELGGVAFFAHIGGFLAGVVLAIATRPRGDIAKHTSFV
ncbi:MAG: hypothetical protein A3J48_02560 [Candidatus Doudnabacteria bacterium RIFCSPHIGHO2_02_FULL_46_11]|uniref:Peptidase S54 rhomboid domain-containing protein n=1 Tax=Candidatus Doudnabacteria bacterium RIFCSPHIGHO2_02_FULL_46_11 TaxID=1817832 RepID=A0A1F5P923_9BACT|nr:MAG: hypothetical protein A3J48_02560 [Candidatus Doudnabacteria bacterium RIFCSPHIGHO2_02_FULL_46_11]